MSPPPVWSRRNRLPGDDGNPPLAPGSQVQAGKHSVAAGGDVGAVITGDSNAITHVYVVPSAAQSGSDEPVTRPVSACHPLDLEVHHAIRLAPTEAILPVYVPREHDAHLQRIVDAARGGRSQLCVLVGESSTGKTRACWEAIQVLAAEEWRLWHPFDPTRADAALAGLASVGPRTVVWLNEAQHYLAHAQVGEQIAAALRTLLADTRRAPILVLGTLWPVHRDQLTSLPSSGEDPHAQSRPLLAGRQVHVPDAFTDGDLVAVRSAARLDGRLAQALAGAADRRITQFLAGVPALLERYEHAGPAARAVLNAAVDARRLGCGVDLPVSFLEEAATGYLPGSVFESLDDDWLQQALVYAERPVHGDARLLQRARRAPGNTPVDSCFRLADYMEQHGRRTRRDLCPPASFWNAALHHLPGPADVFALATAAEARWRLRYSRLLAERARALSRQEPALPVEGQSYASDWPDESDIWPADHPTCRALADLAFAAAETDDYEQAATLALEAASCCQPDALADIALQHERAGLTAEASDLAHHAAANGAAYCLGRLAMMREEADLYEHAEHYARAAAEYGLTGTLAELAVRREAAGNKERALDLWEVAAEFGHPEALANIARLQHEAYDTDGAARTAREALDRGDAHPFHRHRIEPLWEKLWPHGIEPDGSPSPSTPTA
ncbi:hypothetical protein [Streptomyces sp. NBC_00147]|uniref:hypothetical protein n=1 Tax=Streptomyces sp. NBC_00147 TaxID=2975667 RepID=UPI00324A5441